MLTYFSWWYYEEPLYLCKAVLVITGKIYDTFSIGLLIRTLFDPWKKDVIYLENASLDERFKIMVENLVSRLIGFVVRLFTIIVGLIFTGFCFLLQLLLFTLWLSLPIIIIFLIVNGLKMISNG